MLVKMRNSKYDIDSNRMETQQKDHFKILYWNYLPSKVVYFKILSLSLCVCMLQNTVTIQLNPYSS